MKIKKIRKKIEKHLLRAEDSDFDIKIGDFVLHICFKINIKNNYPISMIISSNQSDFKELEFENGEKEIEEILTVIDNIQKHIINLNSIFSKLISSLNKEFKKDFWLKNDENWFKENYLYNYFFKSTCLYNKLDIFKEIKDE